MSSTNITANYVWDLVKSSFQVPQVQLIESAVGIELVEQVEQLRLEYKVLEGILSDVRLMPLQKNPFKTSVILQQIEQLVAALETHKEADRDLLFKAKSALSLYRVDSQDTLVRPNSSLKVTLEEEKLVDSVRIALFEEKRILLGNISILEREIKKKVANEPIQQIADTLKHHSQVLLKVPTSSPLDFYQELLEMDRPLHYHSSSTTNSNSNKPCISPIRSIKKH